jgi:hypothetical protein
MHNLISTGEEAKDTTVPNSDRIAISTVSILFEAIFTK